jgi:hypothetical protein
MQNNWNVLLGVNFSLRDVLHCRNSECCILDEIQNANDVFGDNMNS